jgi:hypothetical protein
MNVCVCATALSHPLLSPAPPPLRPPSLNTLSPIPPPLLPLPPLISYNRLLSPPFLSLSPPSLLKASESVEDRLGQMAQLITEQIETPVEDTRKRGRDTHGRRCAC